MRVDVAINCYGKPWQTLLTVESLLEHSAAHVDRIYLVKERRQPRAGEDIDELVRRHGDRLVVVTPSHYLGYGRPPRRVRVRRDAGLRRSVRYQYALEETDKRYLLVSHNDVLYTADLVGELVRVMQEGGHAGAGLIGQCWNCPAHTAGRCDHGRYAQLRLSRWEALSLLVRVPRRRAVRASSTSVTRCRCPSADQRLHGSPRRAPGPLRSRPLRAEGTCRARAAQRAIRPHQRLSAGGTAPGARARVRGHAGPAISRDGRERGQLT